MPTLHTLNRSPANIQALFLIYRVPRPDGRAATAIDSAHEVAHQRKMRLVLVFIFMLLGSVAQAEPDGRYCSTTKWGHVHCIRPAHFVYDTCNAIKVFADRHGLNRDFFARLI